MAPKKNQLDDEFNKPKRCNKNFTALMDLICLKKQKSVF